MIEFKTDSKWWMLILLAIAVVFGLNPASPTAEAAPGDIYCVASDGDDSNPGTESQPWRTIQKAANTMTAGDSCIVLSGDYDERVQITQSGTSGAPITFQAQGTVTMKGFTVGNSINSVDYITIKGFEITNTDCNWMNGNGIFIRGSHCIVEDNYIHSLAYAGICLFANPVDASTTSNCLIKNNHIYRCSPGILLRGRNHLIEDNEIWESVEFHERCSNPYSMPDGMNILGVGHRIRKNYIHDIHYDDPFIGNKHIDCFQLWDTTSDIVIEQNLCEVLTTQTGLETGQGIMINPPPHSGLVIRNNIIQAYRGANLEGCPGVVIVNNVFMSDFGLGGQDFPFGILLYQSPNAIIKNNIFYDIINDNHLYLKDSQSHQGLDVGHNNTFRSDGQEPAGSPYPDDLWQVDPMFVNAAADDFHLQSNSPAIDVGVTLAEVTNDYEGSPRPQGAGYDIGAYEYAGGVQPTPTPQPTSNPTVTPQPTSTPTPTPTVAPVQLPLRINSAGQDYTDTSGNPWHADQPYSPNGWGYIGGNTVNRWDEDPALNIAGTIDDPLYVAERYAVSGYQVDLPNGTYDVILHFAETFRGITGAGQRVFDVAIEGQTMLDDFDPFAEVGFAYATSKSVPNVMVTDGQLDITFMPNVQNPEINAIEVLPTGGIEPPASPWAIYLPIVTR